AEPERAAGTAAAPAAAGPFSPVGGSRPDPLTPRIASGPVPPQPAEEREPSPLDVFEPEERRRPWLKPLLVVAIVLVVLVGGYVGASYALGDRVPNGATVAGVDIGGLTSQDAVARLEESLADASTEPIPVEAQDVQATIDPAAAGLTFDPQATVDGLTGVRLAEPARLWRHVVGAGETTPVTSVDDAALESAVEGLGSSLVLAPVDGTVVFADGEAHATQAVDGWELDSEGALDVVRRDWLAGERPLELPTTTVEPDITQAETDAALADVATPLASAPVTVAVADRQATLEPDVLTANASLVPTDGDLVLQLNGEALVESVLGQLPDLLTTSEDAHFDLSSGTPVIVPGTPGTTLDPAALATAVAGAAVAPDRTARVELVQSDPSESTAELEALGVKEIVSEFSTPLTAEPRRTRNITNGAANISGTLVRPGETFSLTEALGPVDAAHGYVQAGAIVSGEHVDAWGGGLSQISTTTYNAAHFAGFEDVEHKPHSEWFARYPEGREATIFTGTLDMRWKNNTPYGALVQAWVDGGRVYVRIWGTKYWTVESTTSPRSGVVSPTTVYSQSPTCEPQSAGNPGFSVTVTRKLYLDGELKDTDTNSWRYKPQNKVVCGTAPTPGAAPTP
ncbi:vanomycin resistance protein VanB, partial [Cellulomonas fimi]|uniref:VanW family protein n=1 Tax=Cellulomonas fimi TaxID=1708 RepID=UPI00147947C4